MPPQVLVRETTDGACEMYKHRFGRRLKELREQKGMTRDDLSVKSGISIRSLESWEQGQREPLASATLRLAKALGVELAELMDLPLDPELEDEQGPPRRGRPPKPAPKPPPPTSRHPERKPGKRKR